jgi:uncharacterized protein (TIGR03435 family)
MLGTRVTVAASILVGTISAQSARAPQRFEVAPVKLNRSADPPNFSFPLGPGDVYVRNGGFLSATGFPLSLYIAFAYKMIANQGQLLAPQLPEWAKTERFDIQARAESDSGKDGMRMRMRALLAQRFKLAIHYEDRELPVFVFVLAKKGKTGPQLRAHDESSPCPTEQPTASTSAIVDGLPAFCYGIYPLPPRAPGRYRFGGRNVTIGFIADTFSGGTNLGRPMIDQTGLSGRFDFSLEWARERRGPAPPGSDTDAGADGPSFEEALREQLGIKLLAQKGSVSVPCWITWSGRRRID